MLLSCALLLVAAGLAIAWWQGRASNCPRHQPWAGKAAMALSGLCFLAGAACLALALELPAAP